MFLANKQSGSSPQHASFGVVKRCARASKRMVQDKNGNAIIEFAFVAPIYLSLLFATVQSAIIYFDQQTLQLVADKVQRQMLVGNYATTTTTAEVVALVNANLPTNFPQNGVVITDQVLTSFPTASTNTSAPTLTYSGGKPQNNYTPATSGSVVVLQLVYFAPVFSSLLSYGSGAINFNLSDTCTTSNCTSSTSTSNNITASTREIVATEVFKTE